MAHGWTPSVVPYPWRKKVSTRSPNPGCIVVKVVSIFISESESMLAMFINGPEAELFNQMFSY
jgi:hypothetical protein